MLEVISNSEAMLSRPRATAASPALSPPEVELTTVELLSFEAQLLWTQDQTLAMLGLNPDQSDLVMNPWVLCRLIVLGTLHLVYAAAGAGLPEDAPINQRARDYRLRYAHERARITVELDLDGDGVPDVLRRPWLVSLRRA